MIYKPDINTIFNTFKDGDSDAFAFFYKLYFNDLYAYGVKLGGNSETVKDLIQDIYYKVYFDRCKFKSVEHLKYYLIKSIKNSLYDYFKKYKPETFQLLNVPDFSMNITVLDNIIDEENRVAIQKKIENLLSYLTPRQKEAVYLRYILELEYSEIDEILNLTPNGVRKLVSNAILKLKNKDLSMIILFFL